MSNVSRFIQERTVDQALRRSDTRDDFPLSRLLALLTSEQLHRTIDSVGRVLGATGVIGSIYVEQGDIGNGLEDIGQPRVNVEARAGQPVDAPRAQKLGSSTLTTLARFPGDLR